MITKILCKIITVGIPIVTGLYPLLVKLNMAGVQSLIASGGFTSMQALTISHRESNSALGALKIAIATTGIGLLVVGIELATKLVQATRNQKELNKALKDGNEMLLEMKLLKSIKEDLIFLKDLQQQSKIIIKEQ